MNYWTLTDEFWAFQADGRAWQILEETYFSDYHGTEGRRRIPGNRRYSTALGNHPVDMIADDHFRVVGDRIIDLWRN